MIDNSRSGGDEDDKKIEEYVPVYVVEVAISGRAQVCQVIFFKLTCHIN